MSEVRQWLPAGEAGDSALALARQVCALQVAQAQLVASQAAAAKHADAALVAKATLQQSLQVCVLRSVLCCAVWPAALPLAMLVMLLLLCLLRLAPCQSELAMSAFGWRIVVGSEHALRNARWGN